MSPNPGSAPAQPDFAGGLLSNRLRAVPSSPAEIGHWERDFEQGRVVLSRSLCRIFGLDEDAEEFELPDWQERWTGMLHPADRARVESSYQEALAGGREYDTEYRVVRADGQERVVHGHGVVRRDRSGRPTGMFGFVEDITDRRRAQTELLDREREFRTLAENTPDFIVRWDLELRRVYVNPAFARSMGASAEELVGTAAGSPIGDIPMKPNADVLRTTLRRVIETGKPTEFLGAWTKRTGKIFTHIRFIPEFDFGGRLLTVLGIGRDITAIKENEEQLRTLTENSPDVIARIDPNHRYVFANRALARLLNQPLEQVLGTRLGEPGVMAGAEAADLDALSAAAERAFASRQSQELQILLRRQDGDLVFDVRLIPEFVEGGQVGTVLILARDQTARRRAEEAARLGELRLRTVVDHATDAFFLHDAAGIILDVNQQACLSLGYTREELIGMHPRQIDTGLAPEQLREIGARLDAGQSINLDSAHRRKDGSEFPVEVRLSAFWDEGRRFGVSLVQDVTNRKRSEAELRKRTALFEALVDSALDGIIVVDEAGRKIIQNAQVNALWKIPPEIAECTDDARQVEYALSRTRQPKEFAARVAHLYSHPDETGRDQVELTDGTVLDRYAYPIRDRSGALYGRVWSFRDVTEQRRLEEQLRQSQKMQAIGQLAGGVAHDFNNLLTVIQMQASMLSVASLDPESMDGVREIAGAAARAASLTRQLLTFSRQRVPEMKTLELGRIVGGMSALLRRVVGETIEVWTDCAEDQWVRGDASMLEQVLMNLVLNARDAMPNGGRVAVAVAPVSIAANSISTHPSARAGSFVRLGVSDFGGGIRPENLPRIFEPFFTTKDVGKGTGLGLATVFGIVQQHEGWIDVESALGSGSTFNVHLPSVPPSENQAPDPAATVASGGGEVVLLVEDEPAVRRAASLALKRHGYTVLEADAAAEAFRAWDDCGGRVDLLVTDLVIPGGTSGTEVAAELRRRRPDLRVIFTSGYRRESGPAAVPWTTGEDFLPKPYPVHDLLAIVRRRLDQGLPGRSHSSA